ncbi:hypothetical protein FJZ39_04010 [Candidatus Saccharibacteria bacterium]|nr:hypothetical protein [Candidatus Saccharibacteria bacterium]
MNITLQKIDDEIDAFMQRRGDEIKRFALLSATNVTPYNIGEKDPPINPSAQLYFGPIDTKVDPAVVSEQRFQDRLKVRLVHYINKVIAGKPVRLTLVTLEVIDDGSNMFSLHSKNLIEVTS